MSSRFPEYVNPWRLAEQGKCFSERVDLRRLPRLSEVLADHGGSASFELAFALDENRRPRISGSLQTKLVLQCQRCLEQMEYPVAAKLDLAVIEALDEVARLPAEVDPVLAEDGQIGLLKLLEEELLLAVPQVPRHDRADCSPDMPAMTASPEAEDVHPEAARENTPFAALSALKKPEKN